MNNIVSVFAGIKPVPTSETDWMTVLKNIQSDKYRPAIEKGRTLIGNPAVYRKYKVKLPAVTFCGNFSKNRDRQNILAATGFIIPDLDHLADVEKVFRLLSQDEYVWFCFRSPSGSGLKCAMRADGITTDDDIKVFYAAVERYFKITYALKIDPACKDISRLTFVSYDPNLFINKNPVMFPIQQWQEREAQRFYLPDMAKNGWKPKYGVKVLEGACEKIRQSAKGEQHRERLKQSRLVGGFIASGFIDEATAYSAIDQAVKDSGAKLINQAMDTVKDGIEYGKMSPIYPEERVGTGRKDDIQYYYDPDEKDDDDDIKDLKDLKDLKDVDENKGPQRTSKDYQRTQRTFDGGGKQLQKVHNLKAEILKWIKESNGYFTSDQVDREFGLTTRLEKRNRSNILSALSHPPPDPNNYTALKEKKVNYARAYQYIKKDKSVPGKFHIIDHSIEVMDILNTDIDPFQVDLPFDLHKFCEIPKKGIIMIAGSSDSGKTALILNILKANLKKQFQILYLASEMGPNETKKRLLKFDIPLADWLSAKFIARGVDQGSVIEAHNPDGLTLIDYLEEKEGEYFKITSQIRDIYDSIGDGVAVVGIQKHTESDYGRGGQGTIEKARLSLSLDKIGLVGNDMVAAIKVIKIKNWVQKNLLWHELHFKIKHGAELERLTDWMPCSTVNRKLCLAQYQTLGDAKNQEKKKEQMDAWVYTFKTKDGSLVGITEKTFHNWQENYSNLNLYEELDEIANSTFKGESWLKNGKDWFFQLSNKLASKNKKKGEAK